MLPPPSFSLAEDVSPDGKTLRVRAADGARQLRHLDPAARRPAARRRRLIETPFDEMSVRFSRDGRHLAFASDESGRYESLRRAVPATGEKVRVSTGGGNVPGGAATAASCSIVSGDRHLMIGPRAD